jgi:phage terminase large subunit GpA-like protein
MPYTPRHLLADRDKNIDDRKENLPRYIVPVEARFLVATADVQGGTNGRFVCEVRAFGPHLESWLVDRFSITTTERAGSPAQVDPSGYPEDWDLLTQKLVTATYRLEDGREMRVSQTAVDTGGEAGTTPNAYSWYRRLRAIGLSSKVMLVKGGSHAQEKPTVKGSARTNDGKPMRDMPVWLINTDYYKDIVAASMRRKAPGPGFFHAPKWVPDAYYDELKAEVRGVSGKWKKIRARNEAIDLWVYALAACEALGFGAKGRLSWDNPPDWALPQNNRNSQIILPEERRAERAKPTAPPRQNIIARSDWSSRL